jgi:hypothetical protein
LPLPLPLLNRGRPFIRQTNGTHAEILPLLNGFIAFVSIVAYTAWYMCKHHTHRHGSGSSGGSSRVTPAYSLLSSKGSNAN